MGRRSATHHGSESVEAVRRVLAAGAKTDEGAKRAAYAAVHAPKGKPLQPSVTRKRRAAAKAKRKAARQARRRNRR